MNLAWLVSIINHPGIPWGVGGAIGGLIGLLVGQPHDCRFVLDATTNVLAWTCIQAELPFVGSVALEAAIAILTVVGALVGALVRTATR